MQHRTGVLHGFFIPGHVKNLGDAPLKNTCQTVMTPSPATTGYPLSLSRTGLCDDGPIHGKLLVGGFYSEDGGLYANM